MQGFDDECGFVFFLVFFCFIFFFLFFFFLLLTKKFKMATKNREKTIFGENRQ